jgi:L-ribulokinase
MAAIDALAPGTGAVYEPDPAAVAVYDELYRLYCQLHDTLGRDQVELLHSLKRIREREAPRAREHEAASL